MDALEKIKATRGLKARIARGLGITTGAVAQWDRVPAERAPAVAEITGIPLHELRPDLWPPPIVQPSEAA